MACTRRYSPGNRFWCGMIELKILLDRGLAGEAAKEFLELVPYLNADIIGATLKNEQLTIEVNSDSQIDIEGLAENARALARPIEISLSKDFSETLFVSAHSPKCKANPWSYLVKARMVKEIEPGICYISGELYGLAECLDSLFKRYATSIGAVLESYGSTVPFMSALDNGYLGGFPQHVFFVAS